MSFTSIPNQPIIFHPKEDILTPCEECGSSDYKQLVDFNDQIFYQVDTTYCDNSGLTIYDSEFAGWGLNSIDGKVCSTNVLEFGFYALYFRTNYIFQLYQITLTFPSIEQGTIRVSMFGSSTYDITIAGTYNLYFANPTLTGNSLSLLIFTPEGTGWQGCLDIDIRGYGLPSSNQMKVGIVDSETLEFIDVIQPIYTLKDNKITTAFSLTNVDVNAGCYRLAMTDFCTNTCGQSYIYNGVFRSSPRILVDGWITSGTGTIVLSESQVIFELIGFNVDATLTQSISNNLCNGLTYNVSVNIISRFLTRAFVQIGGEQVELIGTGLQTIQITADGNNPLSLYVIQDTLSSVTLCEFIISSISISIIDEDIQWDMYSDVLTIGDYNDSCKYYKIEGCNAQDQFNFAFGGSSFLPMIRLEGKRSKAQYVTNANTFRYASGKWTANYVNRVKQWTYHFGRLPEYVLDFLSTIFYYDNCYVNGVLMFPQDNAFPTIDWSDADTYLGSFNIDLVEKQNNVLKVQCTEADADCLPSILDNSQEPFLLTQELNRITTQDSVNLYYEN
jgi:hypothetical protein